MTFHHVFEDVPNHRIATVYNLLCALHRFNNTALDELTNDKRFIEFCCHQFWQTAFAHFQLRTNNNYRTRRVVDTLTEKVLTETTLFSFESIRERFQRTVTIALDGTTLTRVIEKTINSFLKHTLLITKDYFGSFDFDESLQTIVTNQDTTIEVVQVRRCKTPTIKRHEWAKIRRCDRQNLHNHPFWTIRFFACTERFNNLKSLQGLIFTLL